MFTNISCAFCRGEVSVETDIICGIKDVEHKYICVLYCEASQYEKNRWKNEMIYLDLDRSLG